MNVPSSHILSVTDARKQLFSLTDSVVEQRSAYLLTDRGRPKAVLMPVEEYESWQETVDILRDPHTLQELQVAAVEYEKGKYVSLDDILKAKAVSRRHLTARKTVSVSVE